LTIPSASSLLDFKDDHFCLFVPHGIVLISVALFQKNLALVMFMALIASLFLTKTL
jgi:hypothetical protein